MAIIYRGAPNDLDTNMLSVLKELPDNYHVFTTFKVPDHNREIDFLVIREDSSMGCVFCLEVKDERRQLIGTINGHWQYVSDDGTTYIPYGTSDIYQNPLQQVSGASMAFKKWLYSMRDFIQDKDDPWTSESLQRLAIFPRLVFSRAHPNNEIQYDGWVLRMDTYRDVVDGKYSLLKWRPRDPFHLSGPEIAKIAFHLGMEPDSGDAYLPVVKAPRQERISTVSFAPCPIERRTLPSRSANEKVEIGNEKAGNGAETAQLVDLMLKLHEEVNTLREVVVQQARLLEALTTIVQQQRQPVSLVERDASLREEHALAS